MAKTLNSVSYTILLIVLVMASTGIIKSEAQGIECFNKGATRCPLAANRVFFQECGPVPFTTGDCPCCQCCLQTYGSPDVCWAVVEGSDNHCHCYKHV
ncbi:hypothetical protein Bca4012_009497 [Brassica carinata]|uniref:Uncharacterized protein n=1 Tax=Brassica carinata TaxID=52824 RepID=A0A8X7V145_BRACI|nr:hypothetical protein Bca52824_034761 [Brassica carinata]